MKLSVYDLCFKLYKVNDITITAVTNKDDVESFETKHFTNPLDFESYKMRDFEVVQFSVPKENAIEIFAFREIKEDKE